MKLQRICSNAKKNKEGVELILFSTDDLFVKCDCRKLVLKKDSAMFGFIKLMPIFGLNFHRIRYRGFFFLGAPESNFEADL